MHSSWTSMPDMHVTRRLRAANNSWSSDNGRKNLPTSDKIATLVGHFVRPIFCCNVWLYHLQIKFDFLIHNSFECTFVFVSDQIFLLSDQNGAPVGHRLEWACYWLQNNILIKVAPAKHWIISFCYHFLSHLRDYWITMQFFFLTALLTINYTSYKSYIEQNK